MLLALLVGCALEPADGYGQIEPTIEKCERVIHIDDFAPENDYWIVPIDEDRLFELTMTYVIEGEVVRQPGTDYEIEGGWLTSFEYAAQRCELAQWEE